MSVMIAQFLGVNLQFTVDYCSLMCPRLSSINKNVTRSLLILILQSLHGSNTILAAITAKQHLIKQEQDIIDTTVHRSSTNTQK